MKNRNTKLLCDSIFIAIISIVIMFTPSAAEVQKSAYSMLDYIANIAVGMFILGYLVSFYIFAKSKMNIFISILAPIGVGGILTATFGTCLIVYRNFIPIPPENLLIWLPYVVLAIVFSAVIFWLIHSFVDIYKSQEN